MVKLATMVKNGEPAMTLLGSNISMSRNNYVEVCDSLRFYDLSDEGVERLKRDHVKSLRNPTIAALEHKPGCMKCGNRFHTIETCWKEHPELKKEYLKKNKGAYKGRKPYAKVKSDGDKKSFSFPKPAKSVSMITDSGHNCSDIDVIFLDTCASDSLFILTERHFFDKLAKVSNTVGCAEVGTHLNIEGVGTMDGEQNIYYCPNGRRNILSLSRLHEWGFGFAGDPSAPPVIQLDGVPVPN